MLEVETGSRQKVLLRRRPGDRVRGLYQVIRPAIQIRSGADSELMHVTDMMNTRAAQADVGVSA